MECQLENITVHYESVGEGRPILMLHGASLDYRHILNDMEPAFADRPGWRRIYLDLPGHGRTPAPDWIINHDDILGVILRFIDRVIPDQRFTLVGESWGGYFSRAVLAQRFAHIDGICLIVTGMKLYDTDLEQIIVVDNLQLVAEADAIDPRAGESMRAQAVQIPEVLDWWLTNSRPAKEIFDIPFWERVWQTPHRDFTFNINVLPQPFPGPALFLMGRQDSIVRYADTWPIVDDYPRATVALLDRAGHLAMVHQRHLFNALVNEWLDRLEEYLSR